MVSYASPLPRILQLYTSSATSAILDLCPPTLNRYMLLVRTRCSRQYSSKTYQLFPQYVPPSLPAVPASIPLKLTSCSPSMFLHPYPLFQPVYLSKLTSSSPQYVPSNLPAVPAKITLKTYQLFPCTFLNPYPLSPPVCPVTLAG